MSVCGFRRTFTIATTAVALSLALASAAAAQGSPDTLRNASRLGGATSFYRPPVTTVAGLKRMMAQPRIVADIRNVLDQAGVSSTADAVVATLTGSSTAVRGAPCADATPADGTLVECDFEPGGTLLWMAYRPRGQKGPGLLRGIRWAGEKPFRAYLFRVTQDDRIYTFVLPTACANLSLARVQDIAKPPAQISVDRTCAPDGTLRAVVKAGGDLSRVARVRVAIDGRPAGELTAPSWSITTDSSGTYSFEASDSTSRSYPVTRASIVVEACPVTRVAPPPITVVKPTCDVSLTSARVKNGYQIMIDATRSSTGTSEADPAVSVEVRDATGAVVGKTITLDSSRTGAIVVRQPGTYRATATVSTPRAVVSGNNRYEGSSTCESSVAAEPPPAAGGPLFFFDGLVGKEQHMRPTEDSTLEYGQCSPLLGLKVGVAKPFANGWEVAGAAGVAVSLVTADDKVRESALFVDAEVNKYLGGGSFIGTGLSFWDLTRSDTFTPAWLLHFGVPVNKGARFPVFIIAEGRLFLDHTDDLANNYQFWGGVRVQIPRR